VSYFGFLLSELPHDKGIKQAISLITSYGSTRIWETYNLAKDMKQDNKITITTAHASKGLEYDVVYLEDDMNSKDDLSINDIRLYYVACTRAKHKLYNATLLEEL
jgi:ATP-dependent exoDNAse (exonuclease V) beta subunit